MNKVTNKRKTNLDKAPHGLGGILIPRKKTTSVNSIFRAANILICLSNGVNTITDIASRCQLSKSSVHRLLKSLEEPQLVVSDTVNHRYYLGPLVSQLASNPKTSHELFTNSAITEMERLSAISEETVSLVIMTGIRIIMLYEIPSKHSLKVTDYIPSHIHDSKQPFSLGATESVLLSQLNDDDLEIAIAAIKKEASDGVSPADQLQLINQLKQIRQQGYSVTYGARVPGGLGISAPIKNYVAPAALSIVGPESRLIPKLLSLIEELKVSADRVSELLSGSINNIR